MGGLLRYGDMSDALLFIILGGWREVACGPVFWVAAGCWYVVVMAIGDVPVEEFLQ